MRGVHFFMLLVLVPAILALGHDIFLFTQNGSVNELTTTIQDQDEGVRTLFSDLGFVWTEYHPESYKQTVEALEPEQWAKINKVLAHKAVLVGLAFAGMFYVLLFILKLFGAWPFRGTQGERIAANKSVDDILKKGSGKKMKYKRK